MRLRPRTLSTSLVATVVAMVAVVGVLVAVVSTLAMEAYLTGQLDQQVTSALARAADPGPIHRQVDPSGNPVDAPFGQGPGTLVVEFSNNNTGVVLTDAGGLRRLGENALGGLSNVPTDGTAETVALPEVGQYRVMALADPRGSTVVVGLPTVDITNTTHSLLAWGLLVALCGVLISAFIGHALIRRQLRPLRDVAATAHEVADLPLSAGGTSIETRVAEHHTDPATEVGQVGGALNTLLAHVDAAFDARHRSEQQIRQFVADASHELRTPLSTIHGYAELSRRTPDDPRALSHALGKVEIEATRMSSLVQDLLLLARLDAGRPLERAEVDLSRLVLEAVTDARVVNGDHVWRMSLPDEPLTVEGDALRLHQVITNLLNNASRHTPAGTIVMARLAGSHEDVVIEVHDDGPGLSEDLAGHAFERFTRGDSSRTRTSGGVGLGLSLVEAIAGAHGGSAAVRSSPGDTTFAITLPCRA